MKPSPSDLPKPDAPRATVSIATDAATGRHYLEGQETATADAATVFGNGRFEPLSNWHGQKLANRALAFEVEVERCFHAVADDDFDDRAEIYRYRISRWYRKRDTDILESEVFLDWQDFNGDAPPPDPLGYDRLLHLAVARLRHTRYEKEVFAPLTVGS